MILTRVILACKLGRPLLPKMQACHTCDNPPCVNPEHLFENTPLYNTRDKIKKCRARYLEGEEQPTSRLSKEEVLEIKVLLKQNLPQKEIANMYSISQQHVSDINTNRRWKHLLIKGYQYEGHTRSHS